MGARRFSRSLKRDGSHKDGQPLHRILLAAAMADHILASAAASSILGIEEGLTKVGLPGGALQAPAGVKRELDIFWDLFLVQEDLALSGTLPKASTEKPSLPLTAFSSWGPHACAILTRWAALGFGAWERSARSGPKQNKRQWSRSPNFGPHSLRSQAAGLREQTACRRGAAGQGGLLGVLSLRPSGGDREGCGNRRTRRWPQGRRGLPCVLRSGEVSDLLLRAPGGGDKSRNSFLGDRPFRAYSKSPKPFGGIERPPQGKRPAHRRGLSTRAAGPAVHSSWSSVTANSLAPAPTPLLSLPLVIRPDGFRGADRVHGRKPRCGWRFLTCWSNFK